MPRSSFEPRTWMRVFAAGLFVASAIPGLTSSPLATADIRKAVEKALPLIERSSAFTLQERACFTCHHGAHPTMAIAEAWSRGLPVDGKNLEDQLQRAYVDLRNDLLRFKEGRSVSGTADAPGHALWMLSVNGWKPDATTSATVEFFLNFPKEADHWEPPTSRPPTVASAFTSTYLVLRGIKHYGEPSQRSRIDECLARVTKWLCATSGEDTEDSVYRLRALHLLGFRESEFRAEAAKLLKAQRDDGGWGQNESFNTDAYATGTVLAALHDTGAVKLSDPVYQRGLVYLFQTQLPDGSWFVRKRTRPVQPFFQSDFPHGQDQFIAISATSWATYALLKAIPHATGVTEATFLETRPEAMARFRSAPNGGASAVISAEQLAFFRERIQPVLADKCYRCHSSTAEKLRGDLYLDTRGGLLEGGISGPVVRPGDPDRSLLIHALEGAKADVMPPKKKLPESVIADFRKWIIMGAPDPRREKAGTAPR